MIPLLPTSFEQDYADLSKKNLSGISIKLRQVNRGFDLLGHQPGLATSQHETTHWMVVWIKKYAIF